jgi:crotonobetainyl-CoA:carnitine CoA-transferase CaiB-like acyl-CoA transferase
MRVIDFGQYIAGPLTAMLLGDQGADVIHVDPPGGPVWDTPANATWNRGKRSISLELKQPADLDVARRLMASADVVIENFRPGVMTRLGLGAETALAATRSSSTVPCRVCLRRSARWSARL